MSDPRIPSPSANLLSLKLRALAEQIKNDVQRLPTMAPLEKAEFESRLIQIEALLEASKPMEGYAKAIVDLVQNSSNLPHTTGLSSAKPNRKTRRKR